MLLSAAYKQQGPCMRRTGWFYGGSVLTLTVGATRLERDPSPGQLTIAPDSGPPGTTITAKGTGCSPRAELGVFLFDERAQRNLYLKMAQRRSRATWTANLVVPSASTHRQGSGRSHVWRGCGVPGSGLHP